MGAPRGLPDGRPQLRGEALGVREANRAGPQKRPATAARAARRGLTGRLRSFRSRHWLRGSCAQIRFRRNSGSGP